MAGSSDIRAGGAYVELKTKDQGLSAGLSRAKDLLGGFAKGAAIVGAATAAAAVGGITVAVKQFVEMGSALQDASDRTGYAAGSLSELKYAAEQSGATFEDLQKAILKMQKAGNPRSFDEVAASIAAIEDPTKRTQAAIEAWGKGGAALLPMVNDLQSLRKEARDTGNVMSDEMAASAEHLGDLFSSLWGTIKHGVAAVGSLAAPFLEVAIPAIQSFAQVAISAIGQAGSFIQENMATAVGYISSAWQSVYDYVTPIVGAYRTMIIEAFTAIWEVAQPIWTAIGDVISSVWSYVADSTGGVMSWLQDTVIGVFNAIAFSIRNWKLVAQVAFVSAEVAVVQFANQVVYTFGTVIPAWLSWFGDNWRDVFTDVLTVTETIAGNIWKNLANLWDAIVGLFNGDGFSFEWTPLTEGFKSAIKELPKIAEREMGPLEKDLKAQLNGLTDEMMKKYETHSKDFKAKVDKFQAEHRDFTLGLGGDKEKRDQVAAAAAGAMPEKTKDKVFGSFSTAALQAAGGVGSDPTTKELRELRKQQREENRALLRAIREGGRMI